MKFSNQNLSIHRLLILLIMLGNIDRQNEVCIGVAYPAFYITSFSNLRNAGSVPATKSCCSMIMIH